MFELACSTFQANLPRELRDLVYRYISTHERIEVSRSYLDGHYLESYNSNVTVRELA